MNRENYWKTVFKFGSVTSLVTVLSLWMWAGEVVPSFNNRNTAENDFFRAIGVCIVKAAHPTGQKPEMATFEIIQQKEMPDRAEIHYKLEYHGVFTGKKYRAIAVINVDVTKPESWVALSIVYGDNNNFPANLKNLDALLKKLNN